ncbi:MAG: hypothetical protein IH621_16875 [Krumholzibacteria bacterium]|nr:hypothetical protein [Candidatus Krumholzibacteria bacterium]
MAGVQADPPAQVRCLACGDDLTELVAPRAAAALRHLELERELSAVVICCDDLPDGDDGWLRLDPAAAGERRPVLTVFCAPRAFADPGRGPVEPGPAIWEQRRAPWNEGAPLPERFSPAETNAFLHHQFALAADLLRGRVLPELVPAALAEGFAAAWDVVLDGRLERAGLPAYTQAVRRARFSRLFATAGVLMPGHWQIFQSLWDGGLAGAPEVLGAVRQLPRL